MNPQSLGMNYPAAKQRGIYKGNETPQAAGNESSSASGGLNIEATELGLVCGVKPTKQNFISISLY